jgi:fibronectin type 3 domain-containing protein
MKLWTLSILCTASLLILSGCTSTPTPKKEVKVDRTLPVVSLTENGIIVDMNTVAFEWNSIKDPRVEGIYVYKKSAAVEGQNTLTYYDTITSRFKTHYVDSKVAPDTQYSYSFKTYSKDAESVENQPITINTLPVLESVSWIHSITGMPRSAKIIWRPHVNNKVEAYIIERKTFEDEEWEELAKIDGRLNAEYIDSDLNDNYVYMYRVKVLTYDGITSTPSQVVKVVTKALPETIKNIYATRNLPKKIRIDWDKSTQKDFALYYVYRANYIDGTYELIATLHNNTFTDKIEEDTKSYFYRVSAVDTDGLESEHERASIQGMTLARPSAPGIVEAKLVGSSIEISWSKLDPRTKTFLVAKKQKTGWFKETSDEYKGITQQHFIDKKIEPNSIYRYVVYGIDSNGIKSEPSIEVKIQTPESTEIEKAPKKAVVKEIQVSPKKDETQVIISPIENLDLNEI